MKIRKKPDHWPNVSPEQQKEGLRFVVEQVDIDDFEWALKLLTWHKFMTKSAMRMLLNRYRKIAEISYEDWWKSKPKRKK